MAVLAAPLAPPEAARVRASWQALMLVLGRQNRAQLPNHGPLAKRRTVMHASRLSVTASMAPRSSGRHCNHKRDWGGNSPEHLGWHKRGPNCN